MRFLSSKAGVVSIAVLLCGGGVPGGSWAQDVNKLRLDFRSRTLQFRVAMKDLRDAYEITPSGDIQMLPSPDGDSWPDDQLQVEVRKAPKGLGSLTIRRGGKEFHVLVRSDNSLGGEKLVTGVPFGNHLLPPAGKARPGETWTQEIPAPNDETAPRVAATYRYTFRGPKPLPDCADCVEIEIVGLRRFVPGPALDQALNGLSLNRSTPSLVEDRPFAVGSMLFSPSEGFIHRFELNANTSVLTLLPVPGAMRQIVLERVSAP